MSGWERALYVGLGGMLGALARYWVGGWVQSRTGAVFPWGTLCVNLLGSFLLGLLMGVALRENVPLGARLFLGVGVLGGFTTFSTLSYETLQLITGRSWGLALLNAGGSVVAGLISAGLGIVVARAIGGA